MSKAIYQMKFDCGRQGSLSGIFIADTAAMDELIKSRREVYFGEVLGKHSEICGRIESDEITCISAEADLVARFELLDMATGYNPFDYLED